MTEVEWIVCTDPQEMLGFLRGQASDRKLRLFACACCRRIWHLLVDGRSRRAVEASEMFSDGIIDALSLAHAENEANEVTESVQLAWASAASRVARACNWAAMSDTDFDKFISQRLYAIPRSDWWEEVSEVAFDSRWARGSEFIAGLGYVVGSDEHYQAFCTAKADEGGLQARLLRDIFGNPFRFVTVDSCWLTSTVIALAQATYDERSFDRLPILADALEDAGCNNADMLIHCRQKVEHVRGCWIVDLLLDKK